MFNFQTFSSSALAVNDKFFVFVKVMEFFNKVIRMILIIYILLTRVLEVMRMKS